MFYTFFVILKQGEKMLKQIAFGGIALTATGYGIKNYTKNYPSQKENLIHMLLFQAVRI